MTGPVTELRLLLRQTMTFHDLPDGDSYSIRELSEFLNVSLRTLRFYEQSGLLKPTRQGSRRLYSPEDAERLSVIVTLRELEVSVPAIKRLLHTMDQTGSLRDVRPELTQILAALESDNSARIDELTRINSRLGDARKALTS